MLCTTILTFTVRLENRKNPLTILIITGAKPNLSLIMNILFQIRAEKPYYMADPEVDSLVSRTVKHLGLWKCFNFSQHSADLLC